MDDKASVGKISVSSDSVSTLNSEDFVLVSRQGDETPSTNNGSDDEKTGLKVKLYKPKFLLFNLPSKPTAEFGLLKNVWSGSEDIEIISFLFLMLRLLFIINKCDTFISD